MVTRGRNIWLLVSCVTWFGGVSAGLYALQRYERTPGTAAATPGQWPAPAQFSLDPDRHTLVMFLHPQCPCSSASVNQLDRLVAQCGDRLTTYVMTVLPEGVPAGFEDSRTLRKAAAIPGVKIIRDAGGGEADRFGAQTSGHVLLYAPDGRLEFSGGVTASRGHAGDNAASDAIVAWVKTGVAPLPRAMLGTSDVYGCPLAEPARGAR